MLEISQLGKTYGEGEDATHAIGSISFGIEEKEFVCVVGPSGCGKTTLLKCMSGLLEPSTGSGRAQGPAVTSPPPEMALVFQEYSRSLLPWMSVRGNVTLPLRHKKLGKGETARLVEEAVEAVGLTRLHRPLPVGALRRHAAARGDRPRARLPARDPADGRAVRLGRRADARRPGGPVLRVREQFGVTVLFVTHDIDESVYLADRIVVLTPVADGGARGARASTCRIRATRSTRRSCRSSRACGRTCTG